MSGVVATSGLMSRRILLVLGLVAAAYTLVSTVSFTLLVMNVAPHGAVMMKLGACDPDRFCEVERAEATASAAGVRAGDQLRFDRSIDALRYMGGEFLPGDRTDVTVRRGGQTHRIALTASSRPWSGDNRALQASDHVMDAVGALTVLVGLFVMIRGGSRLSVVLLGAGMVCAQVGGPAPPYWWWRDPVVVRAISAFVDLSTAAGPVLFFGFARGFKREVSGRDGVLGRWSFWGLAAATGAWTILAEPLVQTDRLTLGGVLQPFGLTTASWISVVLADLGYALAVLVLAAGWREAPKPERARYGYIVPAVMLIATIQILGVLPAVAGGWDPTRNPVVLAMNVLPLLGLLLLVYAVLRHKVIDLGFAVNRTLVYGVVSAVLLAAFGLIEWGVDHFVPIEGREKNALVDAAIAVGVFLTFHRVRDVVEHGVEGLFFRRWQRAEADLRRFVREAAFITEPAALGEAFARALGRFGEGAQAAVYLEAADGYARAAGKVGHAPVALDANLPALVRLRADLKPIEIEDGALAGCLAAPMLNRNRVIGLALLGPSPTGHARRPDEIELIGWAAHQVGLDLHALQVERLDQQVSVLNAKLEVALGAIRQPA
jgi:hypothetical protein